MNFHTQINDQFPIRKTEEQKAAFRTWAVQQAAALGYTARVDSLGKKGQHNNVVISDPHSAQVIFTAHYDTPARGLFPNLMLPRNIPMFILYQFLVIGVLILIAIAAGIGVGLLTQQPDLAMIVGEAVYFALLFLMLIGPANKHNANDNTSGVAAVFALMEKLPAEQRSKAAFILWDNEEKGMLGSKAFAKEHPKLAHLALVVNLDCVGLGENIIMVVNKLARKLPAVDTLEKAMQNTAGRAFQMFRSVSWLLNSDHKSFKCGVMVCACRKAKVLGYYTPYIHTGKDTVIDGENIPYLAEGLSAFVAALPEENA